MSLLSLNESEALLHTLQTNPKKLPSFELISAAIETLADHWQSTLREIYTNGVDGAPDWLEFEDRIWELGETLRHVMKTSRRRGRNEILDVASKILRDKQYGKGRQTFALLLGDFGNGEYVDCLGEILNDPDVQGHCIKALIKSKAKGFSKEVRLIFENSDGWIRSSAKKYLSTLG